MKRKREEEGIVSYKKQKRETRKRKRENEEVYICLLHEHDKDVCTIYECSGGYKNIRNVNIKEYLL